jgi:hypothetical protein
VLAGFGVAKFKVIFQFVGVKDAGDGDAVFL